MFSPGIWPLTHSPVDGPTSIHTQLYSVSWEGEHMKLGGEVSVGDGRGFSWEGVGLCFINIQFVHIRILKQLGENVYTLFI